MQVDPIGYEDNMNLYGYVGNDPLNNTDPSGKICVPCVTGAIGGAIGGVVGGVTQVASDLITGKGVSLARTTGAVVGGAVTGAIIGATGNVVAGKVAGSAIGSAAQSAITQLGEDGSIDGTKLAADTVIGGTIGSVLPGAKIPGITSGRGSYAAVTKTQTTRLATGQTSRVSATTAGKALVAGAVGGLPSTAAGIISDQAQVPAAVDGVIQGTVDAVDTLKCIGENNGNC